METNVQMALLKMDLICNYEKMTDTNIVCVFVRKIGTPISYAVIFLAAVTFCTLMDFPYILGAFLWLRRA